MSHDAKTPEIVIDQVRSDGLADDRWLVNLILRGALDHAALLTVLILITIGYLARSRDILVRKHGDSLRTLCFKYMLPVFLFRHIWLVQIDTSLYTVSFFSGFFYSAWFGMSLVNSHVLNPQTHREKGWLMLVTNGQMLAFLYPMLIESSHFGSRALACCVLWDLGGNMWVCSGVLFGVAAFYESKAAGDGEVLREDREDAIVESELGGLLENDEDDVDGGDTPECSPKARADARAALAFKKAMTPDVPGKMELDPTDNKRREQPLRQALETVLAQPMLHACLTGLLLNVCGVPLPSQLNRLLEALGNPYKSGMYFLVGFYGDIDMDRRDRSQLLKALLARLCTQVVLACCALLLPIEILFRETLFIALFSPLASVTMQVVAEAGWGERLLKLTVTFGFATTILSMVVQHTLIHAISASQGPVAFVAATGR